MLQAFLIDLGKIEIRDVEIPKPSEGEVVVKVKSALTCGTDLKTYLRGHPKFAFPLPFGHECSGVIYSVGENVSSFKEGDEVMFPNSAPCGECRFCSVGMENLCVNLFNNIFLGAYSEYARVSAQIVRKNMFHKPKELSFTQASFLEPLSCIMNGVRQIKNSPENILIIGDGGIGLMFTLVLKKLLNARIIFAGKYEERLQLSEMLGADVAVNVRDGDLKEKIFDYTDGFGADLVIECTGKSEVWERTIEFVSKGGEIILFGGTPSGTKVSFDATRLHYDQITVKGVFHFTPADVRKAYEFLSENSEKLLKLISGKFALEELPKAFELLSQRKGIKYEIEP